MGLQGLTEVTIEPVKVYICGEGRGGASEEEGRRGEEGCGAAEQPQLAREVRG